MIINSVGVIIMINGKVIHKRKIKTHRFAGVCLETFTIDFSDLKELLTFLSFLIIAKIVFHLLQKLVSESRISIMFRKVGL